MLTMRLDDGAQVRHCGAVGACQCACAACRRLGASIVRALPLALCFASRVTQSVRLGSGTLQSTRVGQHWCAMFIYRCCESSACVTNKLCGQCGRCAVRSRAAGNAAGAAATATRTVARRTHHLGPRTPHSLARSLALLHTVPLLALTSLALLCIATIEHRPMALVLALVVTLCANCLPSMQVIASVTLRVVRTDDCADFC